MGGSDMTKKIAVLVDAHVFDGMFQGTRTYIKGLYSALASSDCISVYLAAQNIDQLAIEFRGIRNIEFVKLGGSSSVKRLLIEIPSLVKRLAIDYVHYQYVDSPVKDCKTIVTIHDVLFLDFPADFSWIYRQKKHLFRIAAKRADLLTTVSEYSQSRIFHHFKIPLKRIHVVKEAIDDMYFASMDKEFSRRYIDKKFAIRKIILYVSRVEPRKNHLLLLQSFLELKLWERGFHLVFVGSKSIKCDELEAMIIEIPKAAAGYFHHFERIEQEDLLHFYRASDLFVYPTRAEGFGFPPLEAAAMKVETLLSSATSLAEFKFFGGRFFDPNNLDELKKKMLCVIDRPSEFEDMELISAVIRSEYNWKRCAEIMESMIVDSYAKQC